MNSHHPPPGRLYNGKLQRPSFCGGRMSFSHTWRQGDTTGSAHHTRLPGNNDKIKITEREITFPI